MSNSSELAPAWHLDEVSKPGEAGRWARLPSPRIRLASGPEDYIATQALMDAVNAAILLGQPLLLTGEPGCGKTELASFVSWKLGSGNIH